ncbi:Uncharacterised protein [Enterobacter hormaechei]|nr:Uncharacterised protein [Enterobacter hormaechei]
MAEGDVGGAGRQRHVDLHIIVGGNAQPQTGVTDCVEIGRFQIFLSQMHAVRLVFNRQPPVVVDKQAGVVATSQRDSGGHIGLHLFVAFILDAQLEGANACLQQALYPRHAVHHRVKP